MRGTIILFIMLAAVIVTAGCIQSPATVAKEVPGVLHNVSEEISTMETPNITLQSVLQPLKTSVDYIQPARLVPTPVTLSRADPIIGNWRYVGDSAFSCNAQFTSDSKATAGCYSWVVPIAQRSFVWTPSSETPFAWMRNYTLMDVSDGKNYTILYSENTGRLTSEIVPGNGYFIKGS